MKKLLIASSTLASIWLCAAFASADYVALADYFPGPGPNPATTAGNLGNVGFCTYTGPDATGTFLKCYTMCSTGAANHLCVANSSFWATSIQAMSSTATTVRQAANTNKQVIVSTGTCLDGKPGCVTTVSFF